MINTKDIVRTVLKYTLQEIEKTIDTIKSDNLQLYELEILLESMVAYAKLGKSQVERHVLVETANIMPKSHVDKNLFR